MQQTVCQVKFTGLGVQVFPAVEANIRAHREPCIRRLVFECSLNSFNTAS